VGAFMGLKLNTILMTFAIEMKANCTINYYAPLTPSAVANRWV
jgi:hypothetical protein